MKTLKSIARWLFWFVAWPVAALFPSQTPWLDFLERILLSLEGIVWMAMGILCSSLVFFTFYFAPFDLESSGGILLGLFCDVVSFCYYVHVYHLFLDEKPEKYRIATRNLGENIKPMSRFRIWWDDAVLMKSIRVWRSVSNKIAGREWKKIPKLKSDIESEHALAKA